MPPKQQNQQIEIVELDSSEDEETNEVAAKANKNNDNGKNKPNYMPQFQIKVPKLEKVTEIARPKSNCRPLDSRSFWKAGDVEVTLRRPTFAQG